MERRVNIFKTIDWFTIFLYFILVIFGWMNIYAATYQFEETPLFNFDLRYSKQLFWIFAAILLIIIIFIIDRRFYAFFAYPIYGVAMFLLIATLVFGTAAHGSKSWLQLGGFSIQPAEFAKAATALALAKYASNPAFNINNIKKLAVTAVIIVIPPMLIILQNDTGSALVYASFVLVLYREGLSGKLLLYGLLIAALFILALLFNLQIMFSGIALLGLLTLAFLHKKFRDILRIILLGAGIFGILTLADHTGIFTHSYLLRAILVVGTLGLAGFIWAFRKKLNYVNHLIIGVFVAMIFTTSVDYFFNNILSAHQRTRINVLLGVEEDLQGAGYNIHQSKIAIGSGGLTGKGYLQGTQTKLNFVPEQSTDFIFCTIGEEWGFIGTSGVIALLVILLVRLIKLAERQRSAFSRIYGYSVVAILFFHTAVNIGMTIGLAPVIGIPLPFFSYGGSSLWGFTILLFIFIRLDAARAELL